MKFLYKIVKQTSDETIENQRAYVRDILDGYRDEQIVIEFRKKNGELRRMVGTKNLNTIPEEFHPKQQRKLPSQYTTMFDIEKQAWRTVNLDTVSKIGSVGSF